jgi:predicted ATP-dependent serine protease
MYRQEMNERSPMRVFQKSMHGGLGRGKLGVVAAGPGVGKTALLVQIALDELLRSRRVLHISHEHAVDHVRNYYSEIFHEISEVSRLREAAVVKLDCERHRLIFSLCPTSGFWKWSGSHGRWRISFPMS